MGVRTYIVSMYRVYAREDTIYIIVRVKFTIARDPIGLHRSIYTDYG